MSIVILFLSAGAHLRVFFPLRVSFNQRTTKFIRKDLCAVSFRPVMCQWNLKKQPPDTASKVSVFGVFLFRIFQYSDWIWRDTEYLSVFSPNAEKWGTEKLRIRTLLRNLQSLEIGWMGRSEGGGIGIIMSI